ncbi:MAG: thioredoxin family protein [Nanoarchaeota archaeon]|nr:thioredoxin family protein [Nanoarchaeota archaeon]
MKKSTILLILLLTLLLVASCKQREVNGRVNIEASPAQEKETFIKVSNDICTQDGKPIIREFGTTWCPHCQWIKETYSKVVNEYVNEGKITAYLWEVDIGDDALTEDVETEVPESEMKIFRDTNKQGSVPTFIFGCKYIRFGNGYEAMGSLELEEKEFRKIIDELIAEVNN